MKVADALMNGGTDSLVVCYSVFEMAAHIEACEKKLEENRLVIPGIGDRDEKWDILADSYLQ